MGEWESCNEDDTKAKEQNERMQMAAGIKESRRSCIACIPCGTSNSQG